MGLAVLPLAFGVSEWQMILWRSLALGIFWILWSEYEGDAIKEELGRGALLVLTTMLL